MEKNSNSNSKQKPHGNCNALPGLGSTTCRAIRSSHNLDSRGMSSSREDRGRDGVELKLNI